MIDMPIVLCIIDFSYKGTNMTCTCSYEMESTIYVEHIRDAQKQKQVHQKISHGHTNYPESKIWAGCVYYYTYHHI